jgi:hypothetical protein
VDAVADAKKYQKTAATLAALIKEGQRGQGGVKE